MSKNGYEHQEDSIRSFRIEEELENAKLRISELELIVEKLSPLIEWITPEKQVVVETKYVPVKCEKRFNPVSGNTECKPMKQLNGIA